MTLEDRANNLWIDIHKVRDSGNPADCIWIYKKYLKQAKSEALEDAEQVAENTKNVDLMSRRMIAKEIRALKSHDN